MGLGMESEAYLSWVVNVVARALVNKKTVVMCSGKL